MRKITIVVFTLLFILPMLLQLPPKVQSVQTESANSSDAIEWNGWWVDNTEVTVAFVGEKVTAKVRFYYEPSGHYRIRIMRDIAGAFDEEAAKMEFDYNGGDQEYSLSFTPTIATDEDNTRGYHVDVYKKELWGWAEKWTMEDSYPPRLRVYRYGLILKPPYDLGNKGTDGYKDGGGSFSHSANIDKNAGKAELYASSTTTGPGVARAIAYGYLGDDFEVKIDATYRFVVTLRMKGELFASVEEGPGKTSGWGSNAAASILVYASIWSGNTLIQTQELWKKTKIAVGGISFTDGKVSVDERVQCDFKVPLVKGTYEIRVMSLYVDKYGTVYGTVNTGVINPVSLLFEAKKATAYADFSSSDYGIWVESIVIEGRSVLPPNKPPYIPSNPFPANEATNQPTYLTLSWEGGDPDGDVVTYSVYFGTNPDPPKIGDTSKTYFPLPNSLQEGKTTYYWRIVANDGKTETSGSLWRFTTIMDDDTEGPVPSNPSTEPSDIVYDNYNGYIRFKVYWSDPSGVSEVKFEFWADSEWIGAYDPTGRDVDSYGNGWYYFDMPKHAFLVPERPGWVDYVGKQINWHSVAWDGDNDRPNDSAWTDTGILHGPYIRDDDVTPPSGSNAQPPDEQTYYSDHPGDIRIQVTWTDDTGIADVKFYYRYNGGTWNERSPSGHSGNTYWYNIPNSEWTAHIGEEITWYSVAWDSDNDWPNDQLSAKYPDPPYKIYLRRLVHGTETEIVGGAEAIIDRFSEGPYPSSVTFIAKVKVVETGEYLSNVGKVEFYVNGVLVGSDDDSDADTLYQITWDPSADWLSLGTQTWEANFTGTPDYAPSQDSSTITIYGQLYQTLLSPKGETYRPGDTVIIAAQVTSDSPTEDNIKGCMVRATIIAPDGTAWATTNLVDPDYDGIYTASFAVTELSPEGWWKIRILAQKANYHDCTLPPDKAFRFEIPKLPDLTITRVWWEPENPTEGDTITIYITESNIGDADAGPHTDRVIIDTQTTDFSDPGLAAGASRTFNVTVPPYRILYPATGTYHIKVILDVNNDVTEKNETNNVWEGEIAGWVRYVPTPEQTEIEISTIAGITYAEVTLTFPDTGYEVMYWGTISRTDNEFSADAQVERWTGVSMPVGIKFSHTYELGTLPPDTYTFTFKAWGTIVESEEFTIKPPKAGVEVSIDPTTASIELKHSVEYTIYVHNTGGETDTYDLTVKGIDPSWHSLSATSVTVEPDQTVEVTLTITPPCTALTYEEEETYSFTVNATSQTDPSIFDVADAELTVYITWEYIYEDPVRHTTLKISTDNKCFRFITPDKDFGIRQASSMFEGYVTVYYNGEYVSLPAIIIRHNDGELRLLAYAGTEVQFCYARAVDYETGNRYMIRIDPSTPA